MKQTKRRKFARIFESDAWGVILITINYDDDSGHYHFNVTVDTHPDLYHPTVFKYGRVKNAEKKLSKLTLENAEKVAESIYSYINDRLG